MTVHTRPAYQIHPQADPPDGYPLERHPDTFTSSPFAAEYAVRRQAYVEHVCQNPAPANTKPVFCELVRMAAGERPYLGVIAAALDYIDERIDCADFVLHSILRLLYQFPDDARISPQLWQRIQQTVLNFKYWPDEPGIDSLCTWTENHQILFASAAYLAGQRYPEAQFTNSGQNGREKMTINRARILRWLELRFRSGFSEWLSHVYYDEDLTALLSLLDFCADDEIRQKARLVLNLMLLDMALNSFQGVFGSTHGRAYGNTKKWAAQEGTTDTSKLLFGRGIFSGFDNMSAAAFVLSPHYEPAPVLYAIANDYHTQLMINRQRMGLRLSEAQQWDLGFDNFEDGMVFLSLEAYAHPRTAALVMRMFDAYHWWENSFFAPFKRYRSLLSALRTTNLLRPLVGALEYDLCRNTREQVNIYTCRTPDYMLSTAQDYRPGYGGDQQHIWQATFGPDAVCFTTHPSHLQGATPDYWAGSATLPRAAQVENVVIVVYHLTHRPALYVPNRYFFTHAWLPQDHFDEINETQGWIFARKAQGYLALRSQQPYRWQTAPGEDRHREVIADGADNIWICELGREALDVSFHAFIDRICRAPLQFINRRVVFESPSQGRLEFGWEGPFRRNGRVVPLVDYPRYDNLFVQAGFPLEYMRIQHNLRRLEAAWPEGD